MGSCMSEEDKDRTRKEYKVVEKPPRPQMQKTITMDHPVMGDQSRVDINVPPDDADTVMANSRPMMSQKVSI